MGRSHILPKSSGHLIAFVLVYQLARKYGIQHRYTVKNLSGIFHKPINSHHAQYFIFLILVYRYYR